MQQRKVATRDGRAYGIRIVIVTTLEERLKRAIVFRRRRDDLDAANVDTGWQVVRAGEDRRGKVTQFRQRAAE